MKLKRPIALLLSAALALSLAACGEKKQEEEQTGAYKAGTYTAEAQGNNGPVKVEVVFTADKIESVTVTEHKETAGIADPALERIPQAITDNQSLAIDAVAGATYTSKAILAAVEDCATQAGADIEALKKPIEGGDDAAKTEEERTADMVIVGSGISGLAAAISAAEAGVKDIVVLEKMATTGGTTAIAGGYLICVESQLYKDAGVDDSLESFLKYWDERMSYSGQNSGYPDMERAKPIFAQTGNTVDWLVSHGVNFGAEPFTFFGPYVAAANPGGGRGLVDEMVTAAQGLGVEIITECTAKELTTDASGAVTGLVAETADKVITYTAPAVVLATGGSSGSEEITAKYSPKVTKAGTISTAAAGCVGDGLLMAQAVGADTFDNFFTSIWATAVDPAFSAAVPDAANLTTAAQLGVNAKGERFASEAAKYVDALGSDMIQDGNAPFWYLYDAANADTAAILEQGVTAGAVVKADTIEALAAGMGVDAAALRATYDRYMEQVKAGSDADHGKAAENLVALETAPFYAVKFCPTTFGSQGGVLTDTEGRVLSTGGSAISGLYATGADSNRYYYNENYVLAASLGIYATTGRITGTTVAADLSK